MRVAPGAVKRCVNAGSTLTGHSLSRTPRFELPMLRTAFAIVFVLCALPARADTRTFLLDVSDDYGVDRCLVAGESCGVVVAGALCRAREYAKAVDFGRVDRAEITGGLPGGIPVKGCAGNCPLTVAITCSR